MFPPKPIGPAHAALSGATALPAPLIDIAGDLLRAGFAIPHGVDTRTHPETAQAIAHLLRDYRDGLNPLPWPEILNRGHDEAAFRACLAMMQMGLLDGPANEADPNCKLAMRQFIQKATENDLARHPRGVSMEARIHALLDAGAEIDDPQLIWLAAVSPCTTTLPALVRAGADINAEDLESMNALHHTAEEGDLSAVQRLIDAGADVRHPSSDPDVGTPLTVAAGAGHTRVLNLLIDSGADPDEGPAGRTPLHEATMMGRSDAVRALLHAGANPNYTCAEGNTPLHELSDLCCVDIHGTTEALIQGGADPMILNNAGDTPFHVMAHQGHLESLLALLRLTEGAVDLPNADGQTPLWLAACSDFPDICQALLSANADPNKPDGLGATPLEVASLRIKPMLESDPGPALSSNQ